MEINEKLLRQIIEDVLAEMQPSDKSVSFRAPVSATVSSAPDTGNFLTEIGEAQQGTQQERHSLQGMPLIIHRRNAV